MINLTCPHCGNNMNYSGTLQRGKRKQCVYCGKSFDVTKVIRKRA